MPKYEDLLQKPSEQSSEYQPVYSLFDRAFSGLRDARDREAHLRYEADVKRWDIHKKRVEGINKIRRESYERQLRESEEVRDIGYKSLRVSHQVRHASWVTECDKIQSAWRWKVLKAEQDWMSECDRAEREAEQAYSEHCKAAKHEYEKRKRQRLALWATEVSEAKRVAKEEHEAALHAWEQECARLDSEAERDYQDALKAQRELQQAKHQEWEHRRDTKLQEWSRECEAAKNVHKTAIIEARREAQTELDDLHGAYLRSDAQSVTSALSRLLDLANKEDRVSNISHAVEWHPESGTAIIDVSLPQPGDLPAIKEVRYVKTRSTIKEIELTDREKKALYQEVCQQTSLAILSRIDRFDSARAIRAIAINGHVARIDPSTGRDVRPCILSIYVERDELKGIDFARVSPNDCFRKLKGVASASLIDLAPVAPIISFDTADRRFVEGHEVLVSEGENIATMPWEEFEHLVRNLFEWEFSENGSEVKVTQASRDGGVDAVIFDPDPLRGGKIVIQAKRYTNAVGVSAVRDLYGTVQHEGANKGILVTTSSFGPDAYTFAKDKPLVLLDGGKLLHLLAKHGRKVRINLAEAKTLIAESGR